MMMREREVALRRANLWRDQSPPERSQERAVRDLLQVNHERRRALGVRLARPARTRKPYSSDGLASRDARKDSVREANKSCFGRDEGSYGKASEAAIRSYLDERGRTEMGHERQQRDLLEEDTLPAVVGSLHPISAPATQTTGGELTVTMSILIFGSMYSSSASTSISSSPFQPTPRPLTSEESFGTKASTQSSTSGCRPLRPRR